MLHYLYDFIDIDVGSWKERIQEPPYNIKVKEDGNFVLLMYDQLNSDMSLPLCQLCRGIILEKAQLTGQWVVVCYPFNKFFNYGEANAAVIEWNCAYVTEKIDGSLIKFWCDLEGDWHMSTNGTIDAFKATISDNINGLTFGNVVQRALGCNWRSFCRELEKEYTYMFELVSPDTQVTVYYPYDGLYYLGQRNIMTCDESYCYEDVWKHFGIIEPRFYDLCSLEDCLSVVEKFSKDEEGLVVCDRYCDRIKVKSPEYLLAAHCANNGKLGLRTAVRLIHEDKVDDFLGYAPMHKGKMEVITKIYEDIVEEIYDNFCLVKSYYWQPKKNFVITAQSMCWSKTGFHFCLWHYDHRENSIRDYLKDVLTERSVIRMIKAKAERMKEVLDDE